MKIFLKVRPGSKQEKVEELGENKFSVSVKEPAKENKANFAVLEAMAKYFKVGISRVRFVSGVKSKEKIIEIN